VSDPPSRSDEKALVRSHARTIVLVLLTFALPATLVCIAVDRPVTRWTLVPGLVGAALILALMYVKWWREGRLTK
jgi:hypothetical protein